MAAWNSLFCPVSTAEKTWTETRMCWFAEKLGIDRLLNTPVILPDETHFPDALNGTPEDVRALLERVAGYLSVDTRALTLEICADEQMPGAAGQYHAGTNTVIRIAESQLADPRGLVATLIHELCHEHLLGGRLLTADTPDHEWLTDLLPVYLGVGIPLTNATLEPVMHFETPTDPASAR
jgi:hypothetical protein